MPHPRPSWPRRLRRLCLFLLLGLVTTVGVAWTLGLVSPPSDLDGSSQVYGPPPGSPAAKRPALRVTVSYRYGFGTVRRSWISSSRVFADSFAPPGVFDIFPPADERAQQDLLGFAWFPGSAGTWGRWPKAAREFIDGEPNGGVAGFDIAQGWPALALWHDQTSQTALLAQPTAGHFDPARPVLPLLPIWPGLAFNTLFYALLWWLAFASARMVKHNRRYRRGLCPICRYDLRADYSQGCSECGWRRA